MRGVMLYGPGDVRVEDRPEPGIDKPTDAIRSGRDMYLRL